MRALLWLILAVLVIVALRKKTQLPSSMWQSGRAPQAEPASESEAPVPPMAASTTGSADTSDTIVDGKVEKMLCCTYCQLYIPASEAIIRDEKVFCCAAHAKLA
ncbi:hypothetical protein BH11PSE12_BH11PSE12_30930 [soil metagenome]